MARVVKRVLRPERLREVPRQFSWVDQALVQRRLIDRLDARSAALYLFLVTVADAQGLSYWGAATLAARLGLSATELGAARARLVELELLAYEAPLYQVLALPDGQGGAAQPQRFASAAPTPRPTTALPRAAAPQHLGELLARLERRRDRL
jgi:hypothetical protein